MSRIAPQPVAAAEASTEDVSSDDVPGETPHAVSLEELATLPEPSPAPAGVPGAVPMLRVARLCSIEGGGATIAFRSQAEAIEATIAPEVEPELVARALADKEAVLVEVAPGQPPLVVGVLATRMPREIHLKGETVVLEAEREVLLRAGRAALRLRQDGDVELVGSRISAASRGLFRLVGRILRLN